MFWLLVYGVGVVVALALIEEPFPLRLLLAACWPLGPLSFVVTVLLLLAVFPFARPVAGSIIWLALAATGAIAWRLLIR